MTFTHSENNVFLFTNEKKLLLSVKQSRKNQQITQINYAEFKSCRGYQ